MADEPEAAGLLALMLLLDSRRQARVGPDGALLRLADQDRTRWNEPRMLEGQVLLERALSARRAGRYQIEAAIAAVHAESRTAEETDWQQIAVLYQRLAGVYPSPVVRLNYAVAVAEADSAEAGLALADAVAEELDGYYLLHATRAELLQRLGRDADAMCAYDRAIALAGNKVERAHLARRRSALLSPPVV
jgi:RNA polymerase sigma-70 factor (ECF subfamily)